MKLKIKLLKTTGFAALLICISLFACKKDNDANNADESQATSLAAASGTSESLYDDVFNITTQEAESNNVSARGNGTEGVESCATVTLSPADLTTFPKTMTIDFGSGCTSADGITRKGKIIAVLSGKVRTTGTTISISFENYFVSGYKLEGTYSITNNSGNGNGLSFTTSVANGKITYPGDTAYYTYSGTHTMTQTDGMATVTFADNIYSLTGNAATTSSDGRSLSITVTTPLVKKASCKNIVSGEEQFTYNNLPGKLNFGNGDCDNTATLTILNQSQTITLP